MKFSFDLLLFLLAVQVFILFIIFYFGVFIAKIRAKMAYWCVASALGFSAFMTLVITRDTGLVVFSVISYSFFIIAYACLLKGAIEAFDLRYLPYSFPILSAGASICFVHTSHLPYYADFYFGTVTCGIVVVITMIYWIPNWRVIMASHGFFRSTALIFLFVACASLWRLYKDLNADPADISSLSDVHSIFYFCLMLAFVGAILSVIWSILQKHTYDDNGNDADDGDDDNGDSDRDTVENTET